MTKEILSYGGGLNSSAMIVYKVEVLKQPPDLVICADTKDEFKHTYEAFKYYREYCRRKNIPFVMVNNKGKRLYDHCIEKKIIPSRMKRDCTTKFKIRPIRRYIRAKYGEKENFIMDIGIDYGEATRMSDSQVKYIKHRYPLVDNKINRNDCTKILKERGLMIPPKSGCWYCPFTKKQGWIDLQRKNPELLDASIKLEKNGSRYPEILLNTIPLEKLKKNWKNQKRLTDYDPTCDVSGSCFL